MKSGGAHVSTSCYLNPGLGIKFDLGINHHFKLEFVDSGLYFVQDENNFIDPFLQV